MSNMEDSDDEGSSRKQLECLEEYCTYYTDKSIVEDVIDEPYSDYESEEEVNGCAAVIEENDDMDEINTFGLSIEEYVEEEDEHHIWRICEEVKDSLWDSDEECSTELAAYSSKIEKEEYECIYCQNISEIRCASAECCGIHNEICECDIESEDEEKELNDEKDNMPELIEESDDEEEDYLDVRALCQSCNGYGDRCVCDTICDECNEYGLECTCNEMEKKRLNHISNKPLSERELKKKEALYTMRVQMEMDNMINYFGTEGKRAYSIIKKRVREKLREIEHRMDMIEYELDGKNKKRYQ